MTQRPLFYHLLRCRPAMLLFLPLLLSGCIFGWFPGGKPASGPISVTYGSRTETVPAVNAPHQPSEWEAELLPTEIYHLLTEQLLPLPLSASVKPPEKVEKGAESSRPLAAAAIPVFSYADVLLSEDVTWHGEVVVGGVVTVAPQATLYVDPGTAIRFGGAANPAGALLLVQGRLVASGTKERPVLFTSRYAEPTAGDWRGIVMLGSEKNNVLKNCRIEGAETGIDASFSRLTLSNVQIAHCTAGAHLQDTVVVSSGGGATGCDVGMSLVDTEADLRDPLFSGNRWGLVAERSSLYEAGGLFTGNASAAVNATDSRVNIVAGKFTENGAGVKLVSSQGSISGCRLAANADYGIALTGSRVKVFGNEITNNGKAGMKVEDGRGAAWSNSFVANGGYDLVNAGTEDFRAMGNWWGGSVSASAIQRRIYDRRTDSGRGRVLFFPVLETKPAAAP